VNLLTTPEAELQSIEDDMADQRTPSGATTPHLRAWREARALTQTELAERAGVTRPTITRGETGQHVIRWTNVRKIAEALSITPRQLLEEEPE
jgi:DNA-binding XRE family transcriptional regulator